MNTIKKLITITLMVLATSLIFTTSIFAKTGTITASSVRLRKEPSTKAEIITEITKNKEIEILDESGDWYQVKYGKNEGYVSSEYVKVKEETNNTDNTEIKNNEKRKIAKNTQIHIIPVYTSSVLVTVNEVTEITVLRVMNQWTYVQYKDTTGWVKNSSFNILTDTTDKSTDTTDKDNDTTETKLGYINVSSAYLREKASKDSKDIDSFVLNDTVEILATEGEWYKVKAKGKTGYVFKTLVSSSKTDTSRGSAVQRSKVATKSLVQVDTPSQREEKVETTNTTTEKVIKTSYVSGSVVNIREKASSSAKIITTVTKRTPISVLATEGNYYKIKINGKIGYIIKDYVVDSLSQIKESTQNNNTTDIKPSISGSAKGSDVATYAKKFIGCKYVYGGSGPKTFDCSGFTMYVFKQFGKSLPHNAATQANYGKKVSKSDIQVGDLLVFYNSSKTSIGHVGIYIGNNRFVHAANKTRGVTTDSIYSAYYETRLKEVRRLV